MVSLLYIASGGALGAVARYLLMVATPSSSFPMGTLYVNILGSFILGAIIELSAIKYTLTYDMRLFLVVGVLGSFTTFSTFSLDTITLMEKGDISPAFIYIFLSVLGSLGAFFVGLWLVRRVFL